MMRRLKRLGCALLLLMLAGCHHPPDEAQVRQAIANTATAAEAMDAGDVVAALTPDFDGNEGEFDRRRLAALVHLFKLRGERLAVRMGPVSMERRGDRLLADFTVTLSSGRQLWPDRLGVYQVRTAWRHDDGDWHCYGATWTRPL